MSPKSGQVNILHQTQKPRIWGTLVWLNPKTNHWVIKPFLEICVCVYAQQLILWTFSLQTLVITLFISLVNGQMHVETRGMYLPIRVYKPVNKHAHTHAHPSILNLDWLDQFSHACPGVLCTGFLGYLCGRSTIALDEKLKNSCCDWWTDVRRSAEWSQDNTFVL